MHDDELRAELASWVHEVVTQPAPNVGVLRQRARSRLLRRIASASAVLVVIVGIALSVNAGLQHGVPPRAGHSGGHAAAGGAPVRWTWYPHAWFPVANPPAADAGPSVAPYLVEVTSDTSTEVVSLASGAQIAPIVAPAGVSFFGVAAAGASQTFLLAATAGSNDNTVQFYEVKVGPGGQPGKPVLVLSVPETSLLDRGDNNPVSFAISPDASMLAYSTVTGLEVVSLATGQATSWLATGSLTQGLSWAGDDHTLAFYWWSKSDQARSGLRLLDTRSKGPLLQVSRLLLPNSVVADSSSPLMTADASKIFIDVYSGGGSSVNDPPSDGVVDEFSTRTGRVLAAVTPKVHIDPNNTSGNEVECQVLWTDASGSQVASFCASTNAADDAGVFVDDNGHIVPTSLEDPVNSLNGGSNSPAISSSLFAW
jgi:hypothetical protein